MASQAASTTENEQQITAVSLEYAFRGGLKGFEQYVDALPYEQRVRLFGAIEEELICR
jgi:hypothetical protein